MRVGQHDELHEPDEYELDDSTPRSRPPRRVACFDQGVLACVYRLSMEVRLEPAQLDLLETLVTAQRETPRENRQKFIVARMLQGDVLVHPGVPEDKAQIYFGDVEVLERYGLVYITYPG